jgi:16S rRNA (guanine966-N2)-methyltransferase
LTRIIAGYAGGRRLSVPPTGTRPTSDRVREAVFSSLDARVELAGAHVLDLYAGSGALGLEALSRGAASALFVESNAKAAKLISRNMAAVGLRGGAVRTTPVAALLARPAERGFDVIFLDPPYALPDAEVAANIAACAAGGWAAPEALFVVERSARSPLTQWPEGVEDAGSRAYGETRVDYGECYRRQA